MTQDNVDESEVVEDKDLSDLMEEFCEKERIHRFEGDAGVRNLETIVNTLGYKEFMGQSELITFLSDNPGAQEALYEWILSINAPEWREAIQESLGDTDE
jgi:hypothetical protein